MMKRKRLFRHMLTFGSLLVLTFFLTACGGDGNVTSGNNELIYVTMSDAPSLDPQSSNDSATANAASQIFERLTDFAADGSVVPLLAENFEAIDDTTWEFTLREGVTFHDGTEFNAEAVKMNFERLLDPEFASPAATIFSMVTEINVIDDHTIQFVTETPFSPLPAHLAHASGSIIAPSAIEEENNGGTTVSNNPVGTGPFKFASWSPGTQINFVKFEDYWGTPANVDSLVFKVVAEPATRIAMLESGEAHAAIIDPTNVSLLEGIDGIELDRVASTSLTYIGFNTQSEPFDDVRVRQAITMALNQDDFVNGILEGQGIAAKGPLSPSVNGSTQDLDTLGFDVEAAKALLAEAGFPNGFETTIFVNDGNAARASIAELAQAQLREIGVTMHIENIEWGAFLEKTAAGAHDMFILGWTSITGDADYGLYPLFHSSMHGDPGNRSFFSNDRVDELLELGRKTANEEERYEIYAELSQLLVDEAPFVYLYFPDFVVGTNGLDGFFQNFNGTPFFRDVTMN